MNVHIEPEFIQRLTVQSRSIKDYILPLFNSKMSINTGISGSSCEIFVFSVRYVLFGPCVFVFLCQAKVNQKQLKQKHKEVA